MIIMGGSDRKKHKEKKHKHKSKDEKRDTSDDEKPVKKSAEQIKREKEVSKQLETPEEKRARRLAKKEAKERKRKEKMGWDEEYLGYTNDDNPFGDEHLLSTFVWQRKLEKEGKKDLNKEELEKLHKRKMHENKIELEKVKKRRLEREHEREQLDQEREMLQREKEIDYYREWEKQEDSFHLKQAKLRSKIRIEDERAKPIDLLARYISAEDDDLAIEMHEPYTYLNGLTIQDLEDLLEDIKVYMELEQGRNAEYWKDITVVTEEELNKLRKLENQDFVGERRSGINQSVVDDVGQIFKGKTLNQLGLLQEQIKKKLSGGEGVDVGYWESLLQQLKAYVCRTRLRERHQEQLQRKLFKLKAEQGIESAPLFPILKEEKDAPHSSTASASVASAPKETTGETDEEGPSTTEKSTDDNEASAEVRDEESPEQSYLDYELGRYSPAPVKLADLEPDTLLYDPSDDMKRLEYARRQVLRTGQARKDEEDELVKKAREGMNDDEAQFSVEAPLEKQTLLWSDKYRPRKPRFFNRVHTGFEWNKYNQTHYDLDNPPPKIVQGYKLNIFYPDLIDKMKPPTYRVTPSDDNKDFGILRFSAGPPYEDIAFKIVNREWEYSYKRGFRSQFQNNIFQLWFHFKRFRYRK